MASIVWREDRGCWRVRWRENATLKSRAFKERAEAEAFAASLPRRRGKARRTASEALRKIAASCSRDESGCWTWTGSLTGAGYGRMTWICDEGHTIRGAHRIAYHLLVARVPDDHLLSVDHLCRNRACVNPSHLELVSQRENVMRSPVAPAALNSAKTHCPKGHPYTAENTYVYTFKTKRTTTRICRTCQRDHHRRYAAQKRAVTA